MATEFKVSLSVADTVVASLADTVTVSEAVPVALAGIVPVKVRVTEVPAASVPIVQTSVPVLKVTPTGRLGLAMSSSSCEGRTSASETSVASEGPVLATVVV